TIGLLPGLPSLPFTLLATLLLFIARSLRGIEGVEGVLAGGTSAAGSTAGKPGTLTAAGEAAEAKPVDDALAMLEVDRIGLEIGYRLIPLVQDKAGTGILDHVAQLRRRFASREGVVLPPVR